MNNWIRYAPKPRRDPRTVGIALAFLFLGIAIVGVGLLYVLNI